MLGGIIPLIHYQEPVCISYQINLILEDKNNAILPMLPATSLEPQDDFN